MIDVFGFHFTKSLPRQNLVRDIEPWRKDVQDVELYDLKIIFHFMNVLFTSHSFEFLFGFVNNSRRE